MELKTFNLMCWNEAGAFYGVIFWHHNAYKCNDLQHHVCSLLSIIFVFFSNFDSRFKAFGMQGNDAH
jgi:hypothetical protein